MLAGTNRASTRMIRQADLANYRSLKIELAFLQRAAQLEKRRLSQLIEAGAPIEPGPLKARLERRHQRRVTKDLLIEVFGEAEYNELKEMAAPTTYTILIVMERPASASVPLPDRRDAVPKRPAEPGWAGSRPQRVRPQNS